MNEARTLRVLRATAWLMFASGAAFTAFAAWSLLPGHGSACGAAASGLACLALGRVAVLDRRLRVHIRSVVPLLQRLDEVAAAFHRKLDEQRKGDR